MKTEARDWYADAFEFQQLCSDAVSQARDEKSQDFAHEMMRKAKLYGLATNVSHDQLKWLCRIADHEMPQRRVP
jgi:hypothetical protein